MKEVFDFLNGKTFYIATVDGDQPKLRPFGGVAYFQDKVYFSTNNKKQVYA